MKIILFFAINFCLFSCVGPKDLASSGDGKIVYFNVEKPMFDKYITQRDFDGKPNFNGDKLLFNNSYPFEIILYKNEKFYYNLPNLGTGNGSWKYDNGRIKFFAKRTLFDMYMDLAAASENAESVRLLFKDRFGPNTLLMQKQNF